jgi:hypothetical protein
VFFVVEHEEFDLGESDKLINFINADGVLFAAVQGLSERLDALEAQVGADTASADDCGPFRTRQTISGTRPAGGRLG